MGPHSRITTLPRFVISLSFYLSLVLSLSLSLMVALHKEPRLGSHYFHVCRTQLNCHFRPPLLKQTVTPQPEAPPRPSSPTPSQESSSSSTSAPSSSMTTATEQSLLGLPGLLPDVSAAMSDPVMSSLALHRKYAADVNQTQERTQAYLQSLPAPIPQVPVFPNFAQLPQFMFPTTYAAAATAAAAGGGTNNSSPTPATATTPLPAAFPPTPLMFQPPQQQPQQQQPITAQQIQQLQQLLQLQFQAHLQAMQAQLSSQPTSSSSTPQSSIPAGLPGALPPNAWLPFMHQEALAASSFLPYNYGLMPTFAPSLTSSTASTATATPPTPIPTPASAPSVTPTSIPASVVASQADLTERPGESAFTVPRPDSKRTMLGFEDRDGLQRKKSKHGGAERGTESPQLPADNAIQVMRVTRSTSPPGDQGHHRKSIYRPSKRTDLKCEFCGTSDSPEWRRGPSGPNA